MQLLKIRHKSLIPEMNFLLQEYEMFHTFKTFCVYGREGMPVSKSPYIAEHYFQSTEIACVLCPNILAVLHQNSVWQKSQQGPFCYSHLHPSMMVG